DELVGAAAAPVHHLDVAALLAGRPPEPAPGPPPPVAAALAFDEVDRFGRPEVCCHPAAGEDAQALQDVAVPVRRVVELEPFVMDDPPGPVRPEQPVGQEELGCPPGRLG